MPQVQLSVLWNVLTGESFVEKLVLLLITAALSGLLLPYVLARYNNSVAARQKAADIARSKNKSILQAQAKLVEDLADVVLTYQTLALDVTWFRTSVAKDEKMYQRAYERYSDRSVDLISTWRSLTARSQSLASPSVSEKIGDFLARVFHEQDTPLVTLNRTKASEKEWEDQHYHNEEMLTEAHLLISQIMDDIGLSKSNL
jgi:hypothetical protein